MYVKWYGTSCLLVFNVLVLVWLTATDCRVNLLHLFIFKPLIDTILNMWQDKTWKVCEVFLAWQMIKTIQFISQVKTFPLNLFIHLHEITYDLFRPLFSKSWPLQTATILNWWYIYTLCHNLALQSHISHHRRLFLSYFHTYTQAVFFVFFAYGSYLSGSIREDSILMCSCENRAFYDMAALAFCAKIQFHV